MKFFKKEVFYSYIKKIRTKRNIMRKTLALRKPKRVLKRNVLTLAPIHLENKSKVKVTIFCGKRDIYEGIASLYSFYFFSDKKYSLVWHEDGSLTDDDINTLQRIFNNIKIVFRKEADSTMVSWLNSNNYEYMQQLRSSLIFGVRLVDINYFSTGSYVLQMDSDVLFLNKPTALLEQMAMAEKSREASWLYNVDIKSSYCTSTENIVSIINEQPIDRFNAGLTFFKANQNNIGYFEEVCRKGLKVDIHYYWEQTLFSLLMKNQKAKALPDSYDVLYRYSKAPGVESRNANSRHYVDAARPHFYSDFNDYLFRLYNE